MLNVLFFGSLIFYFITIIIYFSGLVFKKEKLRKISWIIFLAGFAMESAYLLARGITAGRLPLSNQFEFATAFSWGIALLLIIIRVKSKSEWLSAVAMPMTFLVMSYAALQPKEITELMPALRSAWFGLHIGAAVFSYSSFVIAGCIGLRYIISRKKETADDLKLMQMDYMEYRFIAFGFLLLTVTIISGAIWAEQAWSAFWTWDPKEVWALITWIIYAVYLHLRLRMKKSGEKMAWFSVIAVPIVIFTFIGVNTLLPGLHSYA